MHPSARHLKWLSVVGMTFLSCFGPTRSIAAEKSTATQLVELAKGGSPALREAITSTFEAKDLKEGTAWAGRGSDFFFAVQTQAKPELFIDAAPGPQMRPIAGSDIWYSAAHIEQLGKLHSFYYLVNGTKFGGKLDVPAFGPLSYLQPGVPSGTLSDKIIHTSKI